MIGLALISVFPLSGMSARFLSGWLQLKNRLPPAARLVRKNGYAQATETEPIVGTYAAQRTEAGPVLPDAPPPRQEDLDNLLKFVEDRSVEALEPFPPFQSVVVCSAMKIKIDLLRKTVFNLVLKSGIFSHRF